MNAESAWLATFTVAGLVTVWLYIYLVTRGLWRKALPFPRHADVTVGDVLRWSQELATSSSQIQKAYEWEIAQWSGFATVVLTATLGFLSATVLEVLKNPSLLLTREAVSLVGLGVVASLALYGLAQYQIDRLRREFVRLYSLLIILK